MGSEADRRGGWNFALIAPVPLPHSLARPTVHSLPAIAGLADQAAAPPSTSSEMPVMKLASGPARKATAAAISSGRP